MRGLFALLLVVIVTVDTVRSQRMPPTKTKKGTRPIRRNDNPDFGMPSGKDVPDGMRFPGGIPPWKKPAPAAPAQAVAPAARAAPPPAAAPAFTPLSAQGVAPPPAAPPMRAAAPPPAPVARAPAAALPPTRTKSAAGGRKRNDNPDFGLPSGADYPDAGLAANAAAPPPAAPKPRFAPNVLTRPAPPPAAPAAPAAAPVNNGVPPTQTRSGGRRWNDNPDFGLPSGADYPDSGFVAPPPAPVKTCQDDCPFYGYGPVCGYMSTYDNMCYLLCNNDIKQCDGLCPCPAPQPIVEPVATSPCQECAFSDYDPVCGEEEKYRNECEAKCNGVTKYYSCPPTP